MSRKINLFFLLLVLLSTSMLSGCLTAGLGPQFTKPVAPSSDRAIIYVYRDRGVMTAGTNPGVKLNGSLVVTSLYEVNYFPISVKPGSYTFTPKQFGLFKTTEATVNVKAGQVSYVRLEVNIGHIMFTQMDKDEAMSYMATCYLINPSVATDPRVVVGKSISMQKAIAPATKVVNSAPQAPQVEVAQLYIKPYPAAARIRILNIKPKFSPGIKLQAGRYHIEVTAPGYTKHLEWIELAAGDVRTLRIALQAEKVASQKPSPVVTKVSNKTASVVALTVPANASAEEKRYAEMFASSSSVDIRNAAKNLYHRYTHSTYLASAAEQSLLANFNNEAADDVHSDAMAWLCKALAKTGDSRFSTTLRTVANASSDRKIRRYAEKSLAQLQ